MTDRQAKAFVLPLVAAETVLLFCGEDGSTPGTTVGKVPFVFDETTTRHVDLDGTVWKVKGFGPLKERHQRAIVERAW